MFTLDQISRTSNTEINIFSIFSAVFRLFKSDLLGHLDIPTTPMYFLDVQNTLKQFKENVQTKKGQTYQT